MEFKQKLDSIGKIYLPKNLRKVGFSKAVKIIPNYHAAVMFPANAKLTDVKKSIKVLLEDITNRIESQVKKVDSDG